MSIPAVNYLKTFFKKPDLSPILCKPDFKTLHQLWKPGKTNKGNYFTKHPPPSHHRKMQPFYLVKTAINAFSNSVACPTSLPARNFFSWLLPTVIYQLVTSALIHSDWENMSANVEESPVTGPEL